MGAERYRSWRKLDVKAFLGFSILMGINVLPCIEGYWQVDKILRYAPVADKISRDIFRDIFRDISCYLHFVQNSTLEPRGSPNHDRLGKIRPLLSFINGKCTEIYNPHKEVAVDEAMIKFQGRSTLKQYMPLKPVKHGIKVWVLGDSHNGYFSKLQVYIGKDDSAEKGLGARVVKEVTAHLQGKHHHAYFDNFFTSQQEGWHIWMWDSTEGSPKVSGDAEVGEANHQVCAC